MQPQFFDLYRASVRSAADMMKLSLEQAERLQQQQLQLVRSALEENARSSAEIGEMKNFDDVMSLNSRLAGAQFERMAQFWASVWRAAGDTQKSMIDQLQTQIGQVSETARQAGRSSEDVARRAASQVSQMTGSMQESAPPERKEHRRSA